MKILINCKKQKLADKLHLQTPSFKARNLEKMNYSKMWFQKISIHPPPHPTDGQWKFLGGGGLKGRNFQGVWVVPTWRIFQGFKRRESYETYLRKLFWFVAQKKIEIVALSRKNFEMFVSNVFFFAGSSLSSFRRRSNWSKLCEENLLYFRVSGHFAWLRTYDLFCTSAFRAKK